MKLHAPVPIVRIFDERAAVAHYVEFLGFTVEWTHRFDEGLPIYMQIVRDGCVLHLSEHHGDCCPGSRLRVRVEDLNALHAELIAKRWKYARPGIDDTPWGDREVTVADPFGNRLTFYERPAGA